MPVSDPWAQWPLSEYRQFHPYASGFVVALNSDLPPEADTAIRKCTLIGREVLIAWTGPEFALLEIVEPVTEDEDKEILQIEKIDGQTRVNQKLELIVSRLFDDPDSDVVGRWLGELSDKATKAAAKDFETNSDTKLFVIEEGRKTLQSCVVMLGVRCVDRVTVDKNRTSVKAWALKTFAPMMDSAPT
jgi:hypothetical protein